jgi:mono/diheme cytochrome c family protein
VQRISLLALGAICAAIVAIAAGNLNSSDFMGAARADSISPLAGLALPKMDSKRGRELYVSKGCVVCHAINGAGGAYGAPLDASTMDPAKNPFEFFARMWLGNKPMIEMQEEKMGGQVELDAQELADIVAFIHDPAMQASFSEDEIPSDIKKLMD